MGSSTQAEGSGLVLQVKHGAQRRELESRDQDGDFAYNILEWRTINRLTTLPLKERLEKWPKSLHQSTQ